MMGNELRIFQVDAFTRKVFEGNPAAVCPLEKWLPDDVMQAIASENNLSETAFFVPTRKGFHIRWFTPLAEVDLCGHATLASAFVLFACLKFRGAEIQFDSRSGPLTVERDGDGFVMDFPLQAPVPCPAPDALLAAFGNISADCLRSEDYLLVFSEPESVLQAIPDMDLLKQLDLRGVIITAPGGIENRNIDFVTRFFAPKYGVNEDPVTGSAFTQLAPYWAERTGKTGLSARQISRRGGDVTCKIHDDRVFIKGEAVLYLEGRIRI